MDTPLGLDELLSLANNLNYHFLVCDEELTGWYYPSVSLLRALGIAEDMLEKNPRGWISKAVDPGDTLLSEMEGLKNQDSDIQLDIPFHQEGGGNILFRFRFSTPVTLNQMICRIGSAEILTEERILSQKAMQLRDHEIEISARIQKTLLTGEVSRIHPGFDIAAETLPSSRVDGDFYEFLSLNPDMVDFIAGDVMGKGVPAALLAAGVKSAFYKSFISHLALAEKYPPIENILTEMNSLLSRDLLELEKFLTLYYCRLDLNVFRFDFIDAGHTGFIYFDAEDSSCWSVKGANMPLGFTSDQVFRTFMLPVKKDDLLFFYSDGITEIKSSEDEMFGLDRLIQLIGAHSHLHPLDLIKKILNVTFFFAAGEFEDDVTAIVVKIKKSPADPAIRNKRAYPRREDADPQEFREAFLNDLKSVYPSVDEEVVLKLLISSMEVLSNCISHTAGGISATWMLNRSRAVIHFTFHGEEYDWYKVKGISIEAYQQNGFGIYLIAEGVDSVLLLQGKLDTKKIILIKEMI